MLKKSNKENSVGAAKTEVRRHFWQKVKRRFLWGLAIMILVYSGINIYVSVLLNRELASIRQKGEQLQFSELEPPAVPDAQNAALIYNRAYKSLQLSGDEKVALNTPASKRTTATTQTLKSALGRNQQALTLIRKAAAMPLCHFPLNWQGDPTGQNPHYYAELRILARLLADQARLEASEKNNDAAFRDVRAIFGISHHLSAEPTLIGFLVAQAVDSIANQALASTLEKITVSAAEARNFEASLPKTDWKHSQRHCLVGERAMNNYIFFRMERPFAQMVGEVDSSMRVLAVLCYPLYLLYQPVIKMDHVYTLRFWDRLINSTPFQQVPQSPHLAEVFKKEVESTPRYAMFTRLLVPTFSRSGDFVARSEVRRRQRTIAFVLAVYRSAHNNYPPSLRKLKTLSGKPLPLDLYSEQPFKYQFIQDYGFILYSVGVNRIDDDGKGRLGLKPSHNEEDDILWGGSKN